MEGIVPKEAVGLTIGIDTQDLYFEYVIRAWGRDNLQSWLVKHGQLDTLEDVADIMRSTYPTADGTKRYRITAGLIDSGGHKTADIYTFCRKHPGLRLRPSKGERIIRKPWEISKIDTMPNGSPLPGGIKLVRVNTTYYKDFLAGKLALNPDESGAFLLHANPSQEYIDHMTAEYRNSKGVWICPSSKRNEAWDCEVLNLTVAEMLGLRFASADDGGTSKKPEEPKNEPKPPQKKSKLFLKPNPYTEGIHES
jgi:phage terminase large subunit GpA-like protein